MTSFPVDHQAPPWGAQMLAALAVGHESDGSNKNVAQVFNIKDYGAKIDGVTGDTTAWADAIADCGAAGGGVVYHPGGVSLCNTPTTPGYGVVAIETSNIEIRGAGPGSVITTDFAPAGNYGILLHVNPSASDARGLTLYNLTGSYNAGDLAVTCNTHAEAGNFAAGDLIFIRTGQTLSGTNNPDSEINEVADANPTTGVITLKYPLAKPYAQEYYITGTSGITSTSVTANPAPFGVSNMTAETLRNIRVRDIQIVSTGFGVWGLDGSQVIGLDVENVVFKGNGAGLCEVGLKRFANFRSNRAHAYNTAGATVYHANTGIGDSDVQIVGNTLTVEDGVSQIHVHEGSANVLVDGNTLKSKQTAVDANNISIRTRAYNITVKNNNIQNGGNSDSITVDGYCVGGGLIEGNTIAGGFSNAITVAAPNWTVGLNNVVNGDVVFYNAVRTPMERLNNTVTTTLTTCPLGPIPNFAFINSVTIYVYEAFNSSGTDNIQVGSDAFNNLLTSNQDVSATGRFAPALNNTYIHNQGAQLNAYYTAGGGAPTTGKALVVVEFCRIRSATA